MTEKIINFGVNKNLVGILSQSQNVDAKNSAILILNSGLVHRPGPFCMNVELSRELSLLGFSILRFDLSTIGDSEKIQNDNRSYEKRNIDDIGQALNFLSSIGYDSVIIMGLCTGADLAHKGALTNVNVIGTVLLDGYGYPTFKFKLYRYAPILFSFKRMLKIIIKILFKFKRNDLDSSDGVDTYNWELPPKSDYVAQMKELHIRNVKQCYIFTGGVSDYYNYSEQFVDCFGKEEFSENVSVNYYELADHTYIMHNDRKLMFENLKGWFLQNFD